MNEEKILSEQELDQVSGGTGGSDNGFEAAWAEYAAKHCGGNCATNEIISICPAEKAKAAEDWAAGRPIKCAGYMSVC